MGGANCKYAPHVWQYQNLQSDDLCSAFGGEVLSLHLLFVAPTASLRQMVRIGGLTRFGLFEVDTHKFSATP